MSIDSKDISVVVQGAVSNKEETIKCLNSIRKYLPQAEIILSTWEGSDVEDLEFDKLILNKDPGAEYYEKRKFYHNINRQIVSTKNGLKQAERKYIMKLRSDLILTSSSFLDYFDKFDKRVEEYKLFNHKVIVPANNTRFRLKKSSIYTPFFISDFWFLGYAEDIKKYFDAIEIVKEPDFSKYFEFHKEIKSPLDGYPTRFAPEQYFGISAFHKYFPDIYMENILDVTESLCKKSDIAIVNNFIVLEFKQHGIYTNKYDWSYDETLLGEYYCSLYNNVIYQVEYKRLIDKNYDFNMKELDKLNSKSYIKFLKLHKYISIVKDKKISCLKKLEKVFISIPLTSIDYIFSKLLEIF